MFLNTDNQLKQQSRVIALHSSASNSRQWKQLTLDMADNFEVLACEIPGYPNSDYQRCPSAAGMCAVADPILEDIQKHGNPVHLLGHSFGGAVALKIALSQPSLIKSLTLYEPAAFSILNNEDSEDEKLFSRLSHIAHFMRSQTLAGRPDLGMKSFVDFWNVEGAWESLSQSAQSSLATLANLVVSDFSCLFREKWELGSLRQLNIPTLMLHGTSSPAVAQKTAMQIADNIPNAKITTLPELGHMAPVFESQSVNPHIHRHIAEVEKNTARERIYQANAA